MESVYVDGKGYERGKCAGYEAGYGNRNPMRGIKEINERNMVRKEVGMGENEREGRRIRDIEIIKWE